MGAPRFRQVGTSSSSCASPTPLELQEVLPETDQRALGLDLGEPPEEELPEAAGALDEPEERLSEDLPTCIEGVAMLHSERPAHAIIQTQGG